MLNHTIYSEDVLYKLCIACCVADCHQDLAIKSLNILMKIKAQQEMLGLKSERYMRYLDIIMAYVYLRLNHQQFQQQQSNLNTSRMLQ